MIWLALGVWMLGAAGTFALVTWLVRDKQDLKIPLYIFTVTLGWPVFWTAVLADIVFSISPRVGLNTGRRATCREPENKVQTTKILADAPPTRPLDGSP